MALLAICDTETSGISFVKHNLLQIAIYLIDTKEFHRDVFGEVTCGNLREKKLVFDRIKPIQPDEWESGAIRANRIGLTEKDHDLDRMALKYTDVSYAWEWIKKNHDQDPYQVFQTISREVQLYAVNNKTFNPVLNTSDEKIKPEPVFFLAANTGFDWPFMERYFAGVGVDNPFYYSPIDVKSYYAQAMGVPYTKTKMFQMAKKFGIDLSGKTGAHTADADAKALKGVVLGLMGEGVKFD